VKVPDPAEVPTVTVEEAAPWFKLGRSAAYEAVRRGQIPSLKFGRAVRVPVAACRVLLGLDAEPLPETPDADVLPIHRSSSAG
jgi:excisionase family DNA binding protein